MKIFRKSLIIAVLISLASFSASNIENAQKFKEIEKDILSEYFRIKIRN